MQRYIMMVVGLALLTGCNTRWFKVPTTSMEPTIKRGSHVAADTAYYGRNPIQRFDLVVVKDPDGSGKEYVKRVIGLGNETIQIQKGTILINGQELKEPFVTVPPTKDYGPLTIQAGQYFLLGDNRPESFDSRNWKQPTVGQGMIVGKVVRE